MGDDGSVDPPRARLSEQWLRALYVAGRMTLAQVAREAGVSATTVSRRLRDLHIDARPKGPIPPASSVSAAISWTPELAWVVGVIATDGNLSRNGRGLCVTSKDLDLLETVRRCVGAGSRIRPVTGGYAPAYRLQWTSRRFHCWLTAIGLTPAKSLTIGALHVPDRYFADFVRGCIDGDGSIVTYVDRYNVRKNPRYVYDRLFVSLASASAEFLRWIRSTVARVLGPSGHLTVTRAAHRRDMWRLRYGKRESFRLLQWMYYSPDVPALRRKREHADGAVRHLTWYRHALSERGDR
jgi:hypothetical protein